MKLLHGVKCRLELWKEIRSFANRRDRQLTYGGNKTGVILSLTSIEPRLGTLHLPLYRMLKSGFKPDFVEVWLDVSLEKRLTPELIWLQERGCRFNWISDLGPHTKLVYAMLRHPESRIITIDDDILLPVNSCEKLLEVSSVHPTAVICNRARHVALSDDGRPVPDYSAWKLMKKPNPEPLQEILPLGYGSILYPPGALDSRFAEASLFQKLCPTGDDLWFTAMRMLKGTPVVNTTYMRGREITIKGTERYCIKKRNAGVRGNNNESIRCLFEEFPIVL